jgi:HSP20 family protein
MKAHEKKGNGSTAGHAKSGGQGASEPMQRQEVSNSPQHRSSSLSGGSGPFRQMREEFDRVFDRFFPGWTGFGELRSRSDFWGLDIDERDDAVVVRAEAPGFEPGDFDLQVRGNHLTLCACHQVDSDKTEGGYEWSRHELSRTVTLPDDVDPEKVEAHYRNGVLTVTLPRVTPTSSRKINVKG